MVRKVPAPKASKIIYIVNCLISMRAVKKGIIAEGPVKSWKYKTTIAMINRMPINNKKNFIVTYT